MGVLVVRETLTPDLAKLDATLLSKFGLAVLLKHSYADSVDLTKTRWNGRNVESDSPLPNTPPNVTPWSKLEKIYRSAASCYISNESFYMFIGHSQ